MSHSTYETTISVNFGDVDPAGIVYYPVIFHYCHIAFERFFAEAAGMPYARLINEENLGFPTVNVSADFSKRISYGEDVRFSVTVARIGRSSVQFRYQGLNSSGEIYFTALITTVAVDMEKFTPVSIPQKYADVFARYIMAL
jgi:YbgC/YbaW family acyl-CoA thioester hydrolase